MGGVAAVTAVAAGDTAMAQSKSVTACLVDIFVAPSDALDAAREHGRWLWAPLLITLAAALAFWVWYYQTVDFAWFRDQTLALSGRKLTAEQIKQAGQFMTPGYFLGISAIGAIISVFVIYAVQAAYLLVVSHVLEAGETTFGQWFSLTAWALFPGFLAIVAMAIAYASSGSSEVMPADLNILSVNTLLFHAQFGDPTFSVLSSITLTRLWAIGLLTYGVMRWLHRSVASALLIVAGPYVVIYAVWLTYALMGH